MSTATNTTLNPAMELALCANFGSFSGWRTDALSLVRNDSAKGAALHFVFHPDKGSLSHQWLLEQASPSTSKTPEVVTLLRLGIAPTTNAEDALDGVDWNAVYALYQHAVHDASAAFGAEQSELGNAVLLDVRRAGMFEKAQTMLPRAQWRDPALVSHWAQSVPRDQPVIVYCTYGHEVGRSTAMRLCAAGVNARYLLGGIDAWQTAGLPLVPRP